VRGEDFLFAAEQLLKIPNEATWRSAVSRAYYAVFHCAVEFLSGLGFPASRGPQAHGELQFGINNSGVAEFQKLYQMIHRLYDRRRLADYELQNDEFQSQATAALWVASAQQAIAMIADCKKSKTLSAQIRQGIRAYENKLKA
jgi:uncharacterized protein (UPF0332 family)